MRYRYLSNHRPTSYPFFRKVCLLIKTRSSHEFLNNRFGISDGFAYFSSTNYPPSVPRSKKATRNKTQSLANLTSQLNLFRILLLCKIPLRELILSPSLPPRTQYCSRASFLLVLSMCNFLFFSFFSSFHYAHFLSL